jgi:hypothetical protein
MRRLGFNLLRFANDENANGRTGRVAWLVVDKH